VISGAFRGRSTASKRRVGRFRNASKAFGFPDRDRDRRERLARGFGGRHGGGPGETPSSFRGTCGKKLLRKVLQRGIYFEGGTLDRKKVEGALIGEPEERGKVFQEDLFPGRLGKNFELA